MSCDFAHHDGSYVLGALSPAERQAFEQHMVGCADCAQSVRELAGLPGLLARVDPELLQSPPTEEPVPDTVLPAIVHQVRRTHRRRMIVTAGAAAAAATAVVVGLLAITGALGDDRSPAAEPPPPEATVAAPVGQAMVPVGQTQVRAQLAFEAVPWGTRLDLTCTYPQGEHGYGLPRAATYALLVHTSDGRTEQVAMWRPVVGQTMRLAAATAARLRDIASVEVRSADGEPVLELAG